MKNDTTVLSGQHTEIGVEALIQYFTAYFPLNEKEKNEVKRLFKKRTIKRRGFLLQQGDVCKYNSFVVRGCFKMYAPDAAGKEHNLEFTPENGWSCDFQSFYSEQPSRLYIEALEPSTVFQIAHDDLLYLFTNYHKFDRNFRIIMERKYIDFQNRILHSISSTAEERYLSFVLQNPELVNRIPNTQIASYLGITPEFLSKIRRKLLSNI